MIAQDHVVGQPQQHCKPGYTTAMMSGSAFRDQSAQRCGMHKSSLPDEPPYTKVSQAAAGKEILEERWQLREREHCERTGDTSLPPRWFQLREGADLTRPQGKTPRFRWVQKSCETAWITANHTQQRSVTDMCPGRFHACRLRARGLHWLKPQMLLS